MDGVNPKSGRRTFSKVAQMGFKKGVFHPELVGVIRAYPKTLESFQRRQVSGAASFAKAKAKSGKFPTRMSIPDGWGRELDLRDEIIATAKTEAKALVTTLKDKDMLKTDGDPRAEEALEFAIGIVRAKDEATGRPAFGAKDALTAAKLVLDFTKAKPASNSNVTISAAEEFLASIMD